jgi:predicted acetyltransferase
MSKEVSMSEVCVRPATPADRPVIERLWLMFRHDMSEFWDALPDPDGTFRSDQLQTALTNNDWAPYLLTSADHPVGLVLVSGMTGPTRILNTFFVVRGARRTGIGLRAAQEVMFRHPGPWEVAFQDSNTAAVHFWRRVATEMASDTWTEEHRPVPGKPHVPPDVWISFNVCAPPS